jgi:dihydrofolate reductase
MSLAVIAALARNGAIGCRQQLPWRLPADLRRFKALTMGHTLVMGRATFDSIGRPLPGRRTIVVTRQPDWRATGAEVVHSIDEALQRAAAETVFVAGGGDVYRQTIDRAERLYLTLIDRDVEGDTFFPAFDRADFRVVEREDHSGEPLPFEFLTLERAGSAPLPPQFGSPRTGPR